MKKALITGISGQDGSYLSELLLQKGYEVHGIIRRFEMEDPDKWLWRINPFMDKLKIHTASIESYSNIFNIVEKVQPDECYHLAGLSFVSYSFSDAYDIINSNINGTLHALSAIKTVAPKCKFYFAASSEMFGKAEKSPQNEDTPFHPRAPYGISKVAGFDLTRNYREAYNIFASSGILYNHESPRRGSEFLTRKITLGIAKIKLGLAKEISLGNVSAKRDWGYAPDYVYGMWLMLQQEEPDDYVIASGEAHSVGEFIREAFTYANLDSDKYIKYDDRFFRPSESTLLIGDFSKAKRVLGWEPKVKFKELVKIMVDSDIDRLKSHQLFLE